MDEKQEVGEAMRLSLAATTAYLEGDQDMIRLVSADVATFVRPDSIGRLSTYTLASAVVTATAYPLRRYLQQTLIQSVRNKSFSPRQSLRTFPTSKRARQFAG